MPPTAFAIVSELAASVDKAVIRKLQSLISNWKSALVSPDQARKDAQNDTELLAANAFASYSATLQAYQAVDFDDLIALPVALFENHPEVREKWQNRLRYLLIDEYQDTNTSQYQLLKLLAGPRAAFTAVGDDDQAIYGWRGADIENLRGLPRDYPKLKLIKLEQNYRSTVRILKAANALIAHNEKLFDKKLWSDLGHGDPITVSICQDNEKEAEAVVMKLQAHRFEHRGAFKRLRHPLPRQLPGAGARTVPAQPAHSLPAVRRPVLLRQERDQGSRRLSAPAGQRGRRPGVHPRGQHAAAWRRHQHAAGPRWLRRRTPPVLFAAAFEQGFAQRVQPRQLAPLLEFCEFINRLQARAGSDPAAQLLTELLNAIAYEDWLNEHDEKRAAQTKWGNVQEFCDWLGKKGQEKTRP
jgi:ATP-dependent DNA helicase Rep